MEIKRAKEIMFFSMLGRVLSLNSADDEREIEIMYSDLESKMEMDRLIIGNFLEKLREDRLLDILKNDAQTVTFKMNKTYKNLFEFISPDSLDSILLDINDFIMEYSNFFGFDEGKLVENESVEKIVKTLYKNSQASVITQIRDGIYKMNENYSMERNYYRLFFKLAEEVSDEDQRILEDIIYYFFNLPYEENPFITTVFLFQVAISLEKYKSDKKLLKGRERQRAEKGTFLYKN